MKARVKEMNWSLFMAILSLMVCEWLMGIHPKLAPYRSLAMNLRELDALSKPEFSR
jgi:hypothetical protein